MLTLSLLRHAKSSWSDARLKDMERPLNARGEKAAPRMGRFMARRGLAPELILCSPALRTRQTLEAVLPFLAGAPRIAYEEELYLGAPSALIKRIRKIEAPVAHAMMVGHNPGLHGLAQELAGSGQEEDLAALKEKLPTAGLAVVVFAAASWSKVRPGAGHLELLETPKQLARVGDGGWP
jgi:phosphohistidine phosphatase